MRVHPPKIKPPSRQGLPTPPTSFLNSYQRRLRLTEIGQRSDEARQVVCDLIGDYEDLKAVKAGTLTREQARAKIRLRHGTEEVKTGLEVYDLASGLDFRDWRSVASNLGCI